MIPKSSLFIVGLLLISFLLSPVTASESITLTFSDLNLGSNQKILIYNPAAEDPLIGEYNTTDSVTLQNGTAYILALKPGPQHWFENPLNMLELMVSGIPVMVSAAMLVFTILSLFAIFWFFFIRRR